MNLADESVAVDEPGNYTFATESEADATCLVIAWFAIVESTACGILPVMPALEIARERDDIGYLDRFFQHGLPHLKDEQRHAVLWCKALADFSRRYPEVAKRARLPRWLMNMMLRRVAVPHGVLEFAVDCLAFELVMSAFYEVAAPRLAYPPLRPVFRRLAADEVEHAAYDRAYLADCLDRARAPRLLLAATRYWWHTVGVVLTVVPLLKALDRHAPSPRGAFRRALAAHLANAGMPGSRDLVPRLLTWAATS